jgi:hypothetical protein
MVVGAFAPVKISGGNSPAWKSRVAMTATPGS